MARPVTEDDRRSIMATIAMSIADRPTPASAPPVTLVDSRVEAGRIILTCEDQESREAVALMLVPRSDITVTRGAAPRRYLFGVPGYLATLPGEKIVKFIKNQNPDLPEGSLSFISLHQGSKPTVFVDVSEEGIGYLQSVRFTLKTFTSPVILRPAASGAA